jgi:hypothetical protein
MFLPIHELDDMSDKFGVGIKGKKILDNSLSFVSISFRYSCSFMCWWRTRYFSWGIGRGYWKSRRRANGMWFFLWIYHRKKWHMYMDAAEKLRSATSPLYLAMSSSSNANYAKQRQLHFWRWRTANISSGTFFREIGRKSTSFVQIARVYNLDGQNSQGQPGQ